MGLEVRVGVMVGVRVRVGVRVVAHPLAVLLKLQGQHY